MATVAGSLRNKVLVLDDVTTGDLTVTGSVTIAGTATTINSTNTSINDHLIELNAGLTGANANDTGLILERGSTGNNVFIGWDESADKVIVATTTADGTATGNLSLTAADFQAGFVGMSTGASSGKFAVMASAVHGSYDFYNNGTSYFNGSVIVDDALDLTGSNRALKIAGTTVVDASRNLTNIGTISSARLTVNSGANVSQFHSHHTTGHDDWQVSPISIRERGLNTNNSTNNQYSPNLNFHWASVVSRSLSMTSDGNFTLGEWTASGTPEMSQNLSFLNTAGYRVNNTNVIDSSRAATFTALTSTGNVTVNNNLYIGDGNDGYFFNDQNGRIAFTGGDFYIQSGVTNYYNYATNQYLGDSSGDNIHVRGNTLDGTGWELSPNRLKLAHAGSTPTDAKLLIGTTNSSGSSAIAQFGGFLRAANILFLHDGAGSGNSISIRYTGGQIDLTQGEGSGGTPATRVNSIASPDGTQIIFPNNNGNAMIGSTAAPASKLHVNSGTTNVVATFQSTDGIAGIKLQDSGGNVELSNSSNVFRIQPAGGTPCVEINHADAPNSISTTGNIGLGNNSSNIKIAYPGHEAQWGASGTSTGQIIIDLPGTLSAFDMTYMEIDIYEYSSHGASKIILGGHNWNTGGNSGTGNLMWYNPSVQIIGELQKEVYLGWRNDGSVNKRVIVIGTHTSSWSYGTVHVSKVSGGNYYNGSIDWANDWNVIQSTSSSAYTKSPTTNFNATDARVINVYRAIQGQRMYGNADMRSPHYYDIDNTGYYTNPASTSHMNAIALADGIYHKDDLDTKILFTDGEIDFFANGSNGFMISSGGFVVNPTAANYDFIVRGDNDSNLIYGDASADKVGIGRSDPQDKLNIHDSSSSANLGIKITRGSQAHGLRLGVNDTHAFLWTSENQNLAFATNGTQRMTIANDGEVGIGVTNPLQKLDVRGGNIFVGGYGSGNDYGMIFSPADGSSYWNIYNDTGGELAFCRNITIGSSEMARFDNNGQLGIGTNNPQQKLQVNGNVRINHDDGGGAPGMTATLEMYGYEGRGVGLKLRDSVNSASSPNNREWFIGTGYGQSGFNIGYASDGSQSSYSAQSALQINTGRNSTFNGHVTVNSQESGIGDVTIGKAIAHTSSNPARITATSAGQLYIDSTNGQHMYLGWYNGSGYDILSEMNARFASYKDRNDTSYFEDPAGSRVLKGLTHLRGGHSSSHNEQIRIGRTDDLYRYHSIFATNNSTASILEFKLHDGGSSTAQTTLLSLRQNLSSTGDMGTLIPTGTRLGFDESGTRSWTIKATGGGLNIYSGDGGGHFQSSIAGGFRSVRYYSSDNTAYYTDPSETSVINKLMVNGANNNSGKADFAVSAGGSHSQLSLNGNQVQAGGTDMNWNSKLAYDGNTKLGGWDNNIYIFTQGGSSASAKNIYFQPQAAGGSATERLRIEGSGAVIANDNIRAPIFYDSNNTAYYLDASSTGTSLTVAGNALIPGYAQIAGTELSSGDTQNLSGMANNQWVTVANFSGARKADIIEIYDNESSRHNYIKIEAGWSYGQGSIQILNAVRHGSRTIAQVRMLYDTSNRTYNTGKLQVYLINWSSSYTLKIKQLGFGRTGWGKATIPSSVEAGLPSGYSIHEQTTMETNEDANGTFGTTGRAVVGQGIDVFHGSPIKFHTTSGDGVSVERGFIDAQEGGHLRLATSGGENIVFQDGGVGGTTNLTILGTGEMVKEATERFTIKSHSNSWDGGMRMYSQDAGTIFQIHPDNNGLMYVDQHWYFATSARAPIFYDSDNTSFYINPGDTTHSAKFRQHVSIGDGSDLTNNGSWGARLKLEDSVHSKIDVNQNANSMNSHWYAHTGHDSIKFGTSSAHDVEIQRGGTTRIEATGSGATITGTGTATSDFRAPIFYDSDNTGYYTNPATGSVLNNVDMRGTATMLPGHAYLNVHSGGNVYWHVGSATSSNKILHLRVYKSDNTYNTHQFKHTGINVAGNIEIDGLASIDRNSSTLKIGDIDENDDYQTVDILAMAGTGRVYIQDGEIFFNGTSNGSAGFKMIGSSGAFHSNGNVIAYSSTLTASDKRLKENIRPLESSLDKVLTLDGVKFDWKSEDKPNDQLGFIAQDVEKVLPEVVEDIENGLGDIDGHKVVNYSGVVPVLVEAIKELKAEIDDLKEQLKKK